MRAIVIDDELDSRELLETIITNYIPDISLVGSAENVATGIQCIHEKKPDVIFLDVELTDGSGFDILKKIGDIDFEVIFVTGFDKYALSAIKFNCIDFILKPFEIADVKLAVNKAKNKIKDKIFNLRFKNLVDNLHHSNRLTDKIVLPTNDGLEFIKVNKIIRLQADQSYTWIYFNENKILTTRYLKEYESILEDYSFYRTHRTHIINLNQIVKYKTIDGSHSIIMTDESEIPLARRKKDEFLKIFQKNK